MENVAALKNVKLDFTKFIFFLYINQCSVYTNCCGLNVKGMAKQPLNV